LFQKAKHTKVILERISKHDDQHAFKELFDMYFDKIFRVAISIIKDTEQAEEHP